MPADDSLDVCPHSADKRRRSALYELASGQEWAVGIEQLRDLGYTRHEIYGMCRRGELTRVGRGVFLVSREQPTPRGQLFIAQLALGPHAFLSHAGAPMAYGLRPIVKSLIEVTVPGRPRRRRDIKVHGTTNLHLRDVCTYQGLRVSTIPRMLIELAPREPRAELEKLVTSSIHNGLFDYDATTGALERYRRWPGMTAAAAALDEYVWVPRDKSTFERDFAAFLAPHADIPPPRATCASDRTSSTSTGRGRSTTRSSSTAAATTRPSGTAPATTPRTSGCRSAGSRSCGSPTTRSRSAGRRSSPTCATSWR
jgi:hypothetical protein